MTSLLYLFILFTKIKKICWELPGSIFHWSAYHFFTEIFITNLFSVGSWDPNSTQWLRPGCVLKQSTTEKSELKTPVENTIIKL
jgi:hypothetical protein